MGGGTWEARMGSESMAMRPKSKWAIDTEAMRARGIIDLFTDTAAILNLLHLSSIMRCPGGHSLSIYARFLGKKRTSVHISPQKGDHLYYIQARRTIFFVPITIFFLRKRKEKLARKARVNTDASI